MDSLEQREQAAAEGEQRRVVLRRIVVGLDASACSRAALSAALRLAEKLHSELVGLFVEDINLLRLYQLPFAQEITFPVATPRPLDRQQFERLLRYRAAELRRELEEEARKRKVVSNFRVVRGAVQGEILAAALEADLLALGRLGHAIARRPRLGSTARAAVLQATVPVLLVQPGVDAESLERQVNILDVLFDGSAAAGRALEVAAYLARQGGRLNVFVWAERDEDEAQLREHIKDAVENLDEVNIEHLQAADPGKLIHVLRRQRHGLLVLGMTDSALPPELVEALLEDGGQQILAVR